MTETRILQQILKSARLPKSQKNSLKGPKMERSRRCTGNFILMMELRKKIFTFRDIIDLPPCDGTESITELITRTMKDLHKVHPEIISRSQLSEIKGAPSDKVIDCFCEALKSTGDSWMLNQEWLDKVTSDKFNSNHKLNSEKLVDMALTMLNCIINILKEKFDMMDDDDMHKISLQHSSFGKILVGSYSESNSSCCASPVTPTSVLPPQFMGSPSSDEFANSSSYSSSSLLRSLRIQAVGKLNPIGIKRLSFHVPPNVGAQDCSMLNLKNNEDETMAKMEAESKSATLKNADEELIFEMEASSNSEVTKAANVDNARDCSTKNRLPEIATTKTTATTEVSSNSEVAKAANVDDARDCSMRHGLPEIATTETTATSEVSSNSEVTKAANVDDARDCSTKNGLPEIAMTETTATTEVGELLMSPPTLSPNVAPAVPAVPLLVPPPIIQANVGASLPPSESLPPPILQPNVIPPPPTPPPILQPNVVATPPTPQPPPIVQQPTLVAQLPPSPPPPPQRPPMLQVNIATTGAPPPLSPLPEQPPTPPPSPVSQHNRAADALPVVRVPSLPPPMTSGTVTATLPQPPPPPPKTSGIATGLPAPPPPSMMSSTGSMPLSPPPAHMPLANGAAPPPPPPGAGRSLRPKKAQTKLRRSSQMGNLYRVLKGKVEGANPKAKSCNGRKSSGSSSGGGGKGMADALAEMTKRSAYFQQIEEDVQKYAKPIAQLKNAISNFNTKDMTELIKFHKDVESVLEKLTDETQVLARFEGFPEKKLEAMRAAVALYGKLNGIVTELQNWKITAPLGQLLDRIERYFNKVKGEIDALERTKDDDAKKFQSQNIHFDFHILVQIKEAMVDVSSSCMELALKERRETKGEPTKANTKLLWRAFQFAFRVYSFAGGHDERADKLTRELAHEIEIDSQNK